MCNQPWLSDIQIGSTKDLHIKVLDLKKGSSYDIKITARNHVGYGKPYQPDEPIVAGKRISKKKFLCKTLDVCIVCTALQQCRHANAFMLLIICLYRL